MSLFLFRFWPVLVPLIAYVVWMQFVRRKAEKAGEPLPHFRDGPLFWAVMASLGVGLCIFVSLGLSHHEDRGSYIPPHMQDGTIVPGRVKEQ